MSIWSNLFQPRNPASPPQGPPQGGVLGWLRQRLGGWAGPRYSPGTPAQGELENEKAHAGPAGIVLPWFPPFFQNYTEETHVHRRAYRKMCLQDANVKPALVGKLYGVSSLDPRVIPASKSHLDGEVADFVNYVLTERLEGGLPGLIWDVLIGPLVDGYGLGEKVWEREEQGDFQGKVVLDVVKPKDIDNDLVLTTDEFRNVASVRGLRYNAGLEFDIRNFVYFKHLPMYGSPVGTSDLRAAYAPWWRLTVAEQLRGIAVEKRAIPFLIGKYATAAQKPGLEGALAAARAQTWLAIPQTMQVEMLNVAGTADDIFDKACKAWKHDIFLAVTGSVLQQIEGQQTDARGSSKVHKSISDLFKWGLSQAIAACLNRQVVRDLVDLNYVVSRYPRLVLSSVDVAELVQELAIDTGLNAMGLDLSKQDQYDRYGRMPPDEDDPTDRLPGQPPKTQQGGQGLGGQQSAAQQQIQQVKRLDDQTPALEVPASPFRFSEEWRRWLAQDGGPGRGRRHEGNGAARP